MLLAVCDVDVLTSDIWWRVLRIVGVACDAFRIWRCFPDLWRLEACVDNHWHYLRYSSGLAVITAELEVIGGSLKNQ